MVRKIENYFKNKEISKTGVFMGEITDLSPHMRALICLLRGFVIFLGSYGTIVGVLKAFDLPYNALWVTAGIFGISMYVAFLYFNKIFFYTGYVLLLAGFTYELVHMYLYANSGYQAIINQIYLEYSDYFKLLSVREAQEFISQREITVSVAVLFVGTFLSMMLNVTISGYMNLFETVLITFPLLEVALFIEKKPPVYCLVMVLTMYIFVGILQASRHQRMQVKGKYTHEYTRYFRKNKKYYVYQGNAKGNILTFVFALIISVVIGLIAYPGYQSNTEYLVHNPVRNKLNEYAKIYVQSGWTAWLNRYDSTGGISSGRLGGIGSVRPDFETDLSVTFSPYTFNTMYLKGFTGSFYSQNQWFNNTYFDYEIMTNENDGENPEENQNAKPVASSVKTKLDNNEIQKLELDYRPDAKATARMNVINLDADPQFSYLPYNTDATQYGPFRKTENETIDLKNGVDITYNPLLDIFYEVPENYEGIDSETYEYYVNQSCTYVPESLEPVLQEYIVANDFFGAELNSFSAEENTKHFKDVNDYRLTMARKIYAHYMDGFKYTMSPGATPMNKDFVNYFLNTQKRGYCVHFASSGALLLRTMGIPARYVEGYCIPTSLIAESAHGLNEEYSEWYEGDSLIDEQGVVNVPVNDSYAHAWIEIYMDGYGFVPFEMTIPSEEEEEVNTSGFGDLFSGLFNIKLDIAELPDPDTATAGDNLNNALGNMFSLKFNYKKFIIPLSIATGLILLGLAGFLAIRKLLEIRHLKKLYANNGFRELVYIKYSALTDYLLSKPGMRTNEDNPLPADVLEQLKRLLKNRTPEITDESLTKLFAYIEKTLYSSNPGTKEEYDAFVTQLAVIKKTLKSLK